MLSSKTSDVGPIGTQFGMNEWTLKYYVKIVLFANIGIMYED